MSEQDVWDAIAALLKATPLGQDVYEYGGVPGETGNPGVLPAQFVLLSVERRYVEPRQAGGTSVTGWRASIRYVGSITASNARLLGEWVRQAFETSPGRGKRITVDGVTSTPIAHETTSSVEPDDGMYSGLSSWTLAL